MIEPPPKKLQAACLILAGGRGKRLTPEKPLLEISGTPIIGGGPSARFRIAAFSLSKVPVVGDGTIAESGQDVSLRTAQTWKSAPVLNPTPTAPSCP